jgi:low affinity Fe/Cu permease
MELVQEFLYRVKTTGPLKTTKGAPDAERNYWIVSEAELDGARLKARLAAPGSDWMRVSPDGFWRPDVRAPFTVIFQRWTFDFNAVATLAVWIMTLFIQRSSHRDTLAIHAKLDELIVPTPRRTPI